MSIEGQRRHVVGRRRAAIGEEKSSDGGKRRVDEGSIVVTFVVGDSGDMATELNHAAGSMEVDKGAG